MLLITCPDLHSASLVMKEIIVFDSHVLSLRQNASRPVIMEFTITDNDIARTISPVENHEAMPDKLLRETFGNLQCAAAVV